MLKKHNFFLTTKLLLPFYGLSRGPGFAFAFEFAAGTATVRGPGFAFAFEFAPGVGVGVVAIGPITVRGPGFAAAFEFAPGVWIGAIDDDDDDDDDPDAFCLSSWNWCSNSGVL